MCVNVAQRRNKEFKSKIIKEDLFNQSNISQQTLEILAWLDINYWMDNDKREKIKTKASKKILEENKKVMLMFNDNHKIHSYNSKESNTYIVKKKNSFYDKIINFIRKLFS